LEERKQYLVAESATSIFSHGEVMAKILKNAEKNSDIEIIRISGDRIKPTLLVLKTTPQIMKRLGAGFSDSILFEEDNNLNQF
jgi:hypothetical protein